jgi:metal-responsive CopG/Arc/MetJ family transcriptional regulator
MANNTTVRKVTISLPVTVLEYADRKATQKGTNRSAVIAELIMAEAASEQDQLAAEGYRFYAREAEEFASASLSAATEARARCS